MTENDCCGWRVPNVNNAIGKKRLSSINITCIVQRIKIKFL